MIMNSNNKALIVLHLIVSFGLLPANAMAEPPSQDDINIYASLCKAGSLRKYNISGEAGLISRRLLGGDAQLSAEALSDEFPGIKDETIRMSLIQGFQDCMYRYVDRFHPGTPSGSTPEHQGGEAESSGVLAPTVPPERRREIVFLANTIEDFKKKMEVTIAGIPARYYDSDDSTEKFPKKDSMLIDLDGYERYKAFQTPSGIPDFSNLTKNDVRIICNTFDSEVRSYWDFRDRWRRVIELNNYQVPQEAQRICEASRR